MKPSLRYSILAVLAVLSLGVALSASRLRLPAFSRGAGVISQVRSAPAIIRYDDPQKEISLGLDLGREVTLQTDKPDYLPGEVIVITSSGWDPGEAVTLLLQEEPNVHGDRKVTVIADSLGEIFDNQFIQDAHDKLITARLTATGESSGLTTQVALAGGNPSSDLDQWANLNNAWVNGNLGSSKARYFEGDSIPYRLKFSNLSTTGIRQVTIEWDTLKGGKHALDYLTTFNRSVPHNPVVPGELPINPCAGVSGCNPASYDVEPIPAAPNGPGSPVAGEFRLHGGLITGLSLYTVGGSADAPTRITISFTATVANPVLTWGGHIATRLDWGVTESAVSIPGSPYHTRLLDLDGSGGNQDRSLSADAVVFPATIKIRKQTEPPSGTSFGFSSPGLTPTSFSLTDNSASGDAEQIFNNIATFGSRSVSETSPLPNYKLTALACTEDATQDTTTSIASGGAGGTASISLEEGETVTCTFTNTLQQGSLRVIKTVLNDNGGTLEADAFTLHVKSDGSDVAGSPVAGSATGTEYTLLPGTYVVSENSPPSGYTQTGFSGDCDSGGSVAVVSGATKTCTITNDDDAARLIVVKHVVSDNGGSASASDFTMTIGGVTASGGNSFAGAESPGVDKTLTTVGSYSVSESSVAGYSQTSAVGCTGTIALGETKTCTITNDDSKNSPQSTTSMSWTLKDQISLTGILPDGSTNSGDNEVTFYLWGPFADYASVACSGDALFSQTQSVDPALAAATLSTSKNIAESDLLEVGSLRQGVYAWTTHYSGNSFNNARDTACGSEVTKIEANNTFNPVSP